MLAARSVRQLSISITALPTKRVLTLNRTHITLLDMASSNLTYPPPEPYTLPTCHPRPLKPLETPPRDLKPPQIPVPPRKSLLDDWYNLSTHIVPAAYPRTTPFIPLPPLPQWIPNKDEFKAAVRRTVDELNAAKVAQWNGELDHLGPNRKPMWHCINRYVRKGFRADGARKGVTLFMAHANGFPKEVGICRCYERVSSFAEAVHRFGSHCC